MLKLRRALARLSTELGRAPTTTELSRELGIGEQETDALLDLLRKPISLDAPMLGAGEKAFGEAIPDPVAVHPWEGIDRALLQGQLHDLLGNLAPRERQVLSWRFGLRNERDHTLQEIGNRLGLSRERIRQIEAAALEKLRKLVDVHALRDGVWPEDRDDFAPVRLHSTKTCRGSRTAQSSWAAHEKPGSVPLQRNGS